MKYLLLILLGTTACLPGVPLSETTMFHQGRPVRKPGDSRAEGKTWQYSWAVTRLQRDQGDAYFKYLDESKEATSVQYTEKLRHSLTYAGSNGSTAFGFSIGKDLFGLDYTMPIGYGNFATTNASIGRLELVLQRPIYVLKSSVNRGGVAIGLFGRGERMRYLFNEPTASGSSYDISTEWRYSVWGARMMGHMQWGPFAMGHGFVSYGITKPSNSRYLEFGFVLGMNRYE